MTPTNPLTFWAMWGWGEMGGGEPWGALGGRRAGVLGTPTYMPQNDPVRKGANPAPFLCLFPLSLLKIALANAPNVHPLFVLECLVYYKRECVCELP